jgi:hypothetical protein
VDWVPEMPTGLTPGSYCAVCKPARRYFQWRRRSWCRYLFARANGVRMQVPCSGTEMTAQQAFVARGKGRSRRHGRFIHVVGYETLHMIYDLRLKCYSGVMSTIVQTFPLYSLVPSLSRRIVICCFCHCALSLQNANDHPAGPPLSKCGNRLWRLWALVMVISDWLPSQPPWTSTSHLETPHGRREKKGFAKYMKGDL